MELTPFFSQQTLRFALFGIATGSLYALVSLGVVLGYRASRVLNFSAGASGAIGAFIFYSLRDSHGVPWVPALIVSLAIGAGLGILTQLTLSLIRSASLVAKVIVTLGLMALAQGIVAVAWGGDDSRQPDSFLPSDPVKLTDKLSLPEERFIIIGLVLVLALILRLVYSKTVFGLATSAVAEDRQVAATSGWSPSLIELVNFALAGLLSSLAAILLAPTVTLNGAVLTLTVLPALAAALVGRFSSFGLTVAAAMVIGVLQSELSLFQPNLAKTFGVQVSSLTGLQDVVPLLIILIVTVASGRVRPARGEIAARLPLPGTGQVFAPGLAFAFVVGVVLLYTVPSAWADALVTTFAMGIVLLSVVVVTGYAGQLSLCQFALAGFGAWVAARLNSDGVPLELALVLGILGTVPLGLLVALPALRTRGVQLAVATLALAQMITALVFMNGSLTGGFTGTKVKTPKFFGINIDPVAHPERYGVFVLIWFVIAALVVANVRRGRAGRRLLAVRSNERAAAALGIGVYTAKLYAFGLASAVAALAGILLGFRNQNVQFQSFDVVGSITAVLYGVLGGVGWIAGTAVGATLAGGSILDRILNDAFSGVSSIVGWLLIIAGLNTVIIFRVAPDGVAAQIARTLPAPVRRLMARSSFSRTDPPAGSPQAAGAGKAAAAEPRRNRPPVSLEVRDVSVAFGGVIALDQVSFALAPGEVVGLIGPNGAGKTTMLDVITGFATPRSGEIRLGGSAVNRWSPERRARAGMARSWQAVELFNEMTIRDNLLVAADRHQASRYFTDLLRPGRQGQTEVMTEVIDEFELTPYLDVRPPSVSQGMARLVGIARSIVAEPGVLLLDEPAAGLDAGESVELGQAIRRVAERRGIGVLLVEHDVDLLMTICDRIVVLDFGRKIAEGTPQEITSNPAVIRAYLGEPTPDATPADATAVQEPIATATATAVQESS